MDPIKPMRSNYETIIADHKVTVVIAHNPENHREILSLTCGLSYKMDLGLMYSIIFYYNHKSLAGNDSEIQKQLTSHVIKHLILINQLEVKCQLHLWFYFEENVNMEPIKYFLSEELGFDLYLGGFDSPMMLCEQKIEDIK